MSRLLHAWFCDLSAKFCSRSLYSTKKPTPNLNELLRTMPKEPRFTENLQKTRSKLKEKGQKYVPGTVSLKVLGSGAKGAPRSLYVFTDQSRYLFNCGEGTQRLAHEHKMRLSKLEQIFVTYPCWENIGGLPGISLTIQDVGVPEITLHGPAGLDEIFPATKRFVVLKDLQVKMADCSEQNQFQDNVLTVNYVHIHGTKPPQPLDALTESSASECEEDNVDYYQHERKRKKTAERVEGVKRIRAENEDVAITYICVLRDRPGSLSLEKCVDARVPAGPMLGQLKAGQDVTLADGTVVRSVDVCLPTERGPVFIVVECPTEGHVQSLVESTAFDKHTSGATEDGSAAQLVVHFSPQAVMDDSRYRQWMERFPPSTHHLVLNNGNSCLGSEAVFRIQEKLHLLHPQVFPRLRDSGIPNGQGETDATEPAQRLNSDSLAIIEGRTLCNFHLRPFKGLDRTEELRLTPSLYKEETMVVPDFKEALASLKEKLEAFPSPKEPQYPNVVFLGTGSCIPNKTRNTSGILLNISATSSILVDCGEGTYGQLVRYYGGEVTNILRNLRAVYISHLHADHHIGLIGLLKGRRQALGHQEEHGKLFLIAPKQIKPWLNLYHQRFEPVVQDLKLVQCGLLYMDNHRLDVDLEKEVLQALSLKDISTVLVDHCPNAFGVSFTHADWKISYSGDTMPCKNFVELGKDSDLLIHEATMEDELEYEARLKLHSTSAQAIDVGRRMGAKFTLLTHFSQRYAKLPRLDEKVLASNVGIAFDNMQVSLQQLPLLPLLYQPLKLMFAEHHDELELKAERRNIKKQREQAHMKIPLAT